jgi:hypothetical protein
LPEAGNRRAVYGTSNKKRGKRQRPGVIISRQAESPERQVDRGSQHGIFSARQSHPNQDQP